MVLFVTGVPGSGKTFFAVNYLFDTFVNKKSKHFGENSRFFTNINGFNYDAFPENGHLLDFELLRTQLTALYNQKQSGADDAALISSAKEFGIDNALFVIDECHNFFESDSKVLVWWLSYHRHLFHNILLITQNLQLVEKKYLSFSEFYYVAQASSLRLLSFIFRYKSYTDPRLYKKTETQGFTLFFKKEVYALYHSGANQQSKKVIFYYIALAVAVFSLFAFGIKAIQAKWTPDRPENQAPAGSSSPTPTQSLNRAPVASLGAPDSVYRMVCRKDDCILDSRYRFKMLTLRTMRRKTDFTILFVDNHGSYSEYLISINQSKKHLLGIQ